MKKSILLILISTLILSACTSSQSSTSNDSSAVSNATPSATYTADQVIAHNSQTDCWLIIHDKVYDLTSFKSHPGGKIIYNYCGQDATSVFESRPDDGTSHSDKARQLLNQFYIGDLSQ